jgi:hypothetical protein
MDKVEKVENSGQFGGSAELVTVPMRAFAAEIGSKSAIIQLVTFELRSAGRVKQPG